MRKIFGLFILLLLQLAVSSFKRQEDLIGGSLDSYLNQNGFFLSPVHSRSNEGYSSIKQRLEFLNDLQNLSEVKNIMEIGFNAGHSSEVFLSSSNCQKLVSFDINSHPYTRVGVEFMKKKFGDRFEFVEGDSRTQVPKYAVTHHEKFDLIFIDGGHTFECCTADIRNCQSLAHKNTLLWIDDYIPLGVKPAVDFCVKEGLITLLDSKCVQDPSGSRSWVVARYQYLTESEKVFNHIYERGLWGKDQSGKGNSGPGSSLEQGRPFIEYIQNFLDRTSDVRSIVDIGCGDWVLGQAINWGDRDYIGIDVVESLILRHQSLFGSDKIHFVHLDVTTNDLPSGDLVICKDVLMHLPNAAVFDLLSKLKKFKYCLFINDVSSLTGGTSNGNVSLGGYRPIDLTLSPFFLKPKVNTYYNSGSVIKQILLVE